GASLPPRRRPRPISESEPGMAPQGLVLGWCIYLLANGVIAWYVDQAPGRMTSGLYLDLTPPAVRWMVCAAVLGMLTLWPVLRLSTRDARLVSARGDRRPEQRVLTGLYILLDWAALNFVFQILIVLLWLRREWVP